MIILFSLLSIADAKSSFEITNGRAKMRSRRRREIRQDGRSRRTRVLKKESTKGPRITAGSSKTPKSSKVPVESPTGKAPPTRGESAGRTIENTSLAVVGAGVITLVLLV